MGCRHSIPLLTRSPGCVVAAIAHLVPVVPIRRGLSGLAVQAVGVAAGQHPGQEGSEPRPVVDLGVRQGHGGESAAVEAVLQGTMAFC